jgi:hypothetical protein
MSKVRLKWVYGNTLNLAILMKKETMTEAGIIREDYVPPVGSVISVIFESNCTRYEMPYTLDGNVLVVTDQGDMPTGIYGCEVTVREPNQELRSMWKYQLEILYETREKMAEYNEFQCDCPEQLEASVFYFAKGDKGDKGDKFEYQDFTPEEIAELQKPATEAASRADDAAALANEKAGLANQEAQYADEQGDYAKQQGDYAKRKADEIEDAKGTYDNLDARLDAMDAATGTKMDAPTEEEFNGIFN